MRPFPLAEEHSDEKACAQHILVKTEKQCLGNQGEARQGRRFQPDGKRFSTCPSGKRGGDLGEFSKGDMVKSFDDAVFKGELLTVLGPVRTKFGFHLIKVLYRS